MILSHGHKFIVFKTRKTGGTSFEIALSKYLSPGDIVTPIAPDDEKVRAALGYAGARNHVLAQGASAAGPEAKFFNHIGVADARALLPADVYATYVKAAILRNPFDYAVSWYFWERSRLGETSREGFRTWLRYQHAHRPELEAAYRQRQRPNPGMFSGNRFVTHIDGKSALDIVLRYERLQEDAAAFARKVGLPESLGHELAAIRTKANYRPGAATAAMMFDGFKDGEEMIRSAFAEEIAAQGYDLA